MPIAIKSTFGSTLARNASGGKHSCEYRTYDSTHAMHAKGVESIVVLEIWLYHSHHYKADYRGDDSDGKGSKYVG